MPISVPYEEIDSVEGGGSFNETRTRDHFRGVRVFKVAWADRLQARDDLLNFPGDEWPHSPVVAHCTSVSAEPFGASIEGPTEGGGKRIGWEHAILTATYETLRGELATSPDSGTGNPDERISEEMFGEVRGIALPIERLKWDLSADHLPFTALKPEEAPSLMLYRATYTLTRHHLSALPAGMEDLCGSCNAQPWQTKLLGRTFAPETLLYVAPRVTVVSDFAGNKKWTIAHTFTYQGQGWNKFPYLKRNGRVEWIEIYRFIDDSDPIGVAIKPVTPANLSVL